MSSSDRPRYRFRQFRRALRPNVRASDLNTAQRVLGDRLFPLFDSMQAADQLHCLDVYQRLVQNGCADAEMLQAALQKLSPELRETVILRDLEELDYREIAQVLEIPEGTVKSRLNRGRADLARILRRTQQVAV